jgi:hypothetical protein
VIAISVDPPQGHVRDLIYDGDLVVFTRVQAVTELVEYARAELTRIFFPHDPQEAHLHFSPQQAASILATWKPAFMRQDRARCLLRAIVEEVGFSSSNTYIDLLKPRTSFPVEHLTTGIAFAFPWHRDTWYAAPAQQINWWLPIFDVSKTNAMKFDLARFDKPVANTSETFDYYQINKDRQRTATQIKVETQPRPAALDHEPEHDTVVLLPPGSILLFSGTHLHASIPNESGRTRYSIDFRTVDRRDIVADIGAPVVDAECTGTSLRDFINPVSDCGFDETLVRSRYGSPPADAVLVFSLEASESAMG